jgi:xanthine/uracil permease
MFEDKQGRSVASLLGALSHETSALLRNEIELARSEVAQKMARAGMGIAETATAGLIMFVGFQAMVAAAIIGLSYVLEWWLAALVVGIVIMAIGAILLSRGLSNLRGEGLTPSRTIATLKDNTAWAREQLAREQTR